MNAFSDITADEIGSFVASLRIDPGDLDRIILHWDGGGANPSAKTIRAYNAVMDQRLGLHRGRFSADDNIDTSDGIYAAHTLHANTRAFGFALCGMHDAQERPFQPGPAPITEAQFKASAVVAAHVLRAAALPLAPHTALSHAEVERVLGIKQRGKWDIAVLPWRADLAGAQAIGDYWRSLIREAMDALGGSTVVMPYDNLRRGNRVPREDVRVLQRDLAELGYFTGKVDGLFGALTEAAVRALQADHGLKPDGIVGPLTREAMQTARPRPERDVSERDLRASGSEQVANGNVLAGAGGVLAVTQIGEVVAQIDTAVAVVERATGPAQAALGLMQQFFWPVALLAVCGIVVYFGRKVVNRRVWEARTGANLSR